MKMTHPAIKKILLFTVFVLFALNVYAHDVLYGTAIFKNARWSPIQISLWPLHLFGGETGICGVNLSPGLLGGCKKFYGISCGQIVGFGENNGVAVNVWSLGNKNNGLVLGIFNNWSKNCGVTVGVANFINDRKDGRNMLQIGLFNQANSGFQIGLLNYNPNALIPWMPLVNGVIPKTVEASLKELRTRPYPFDYNIERHSDKYFPAWEYKQRLYWLNELFPLTDAGAVHALMEAAKKYGLLQAWDEYALTLSQEKRKHLRHVLGVWLTPEYWDHHLNIDQNGSCTLELRRKFSISRCDFTAKLPKLPPDTSLTVERYNSDLSVGYHTQDSRFVTLFTVRRDAETDLWFETGSWQEVRDKLPAVTEYQDRNQGVVCTQINGDKRFYKKFKLKEQYRKVKLGSLESKHLRCSEL